MSRAYYNEIDPYAAQWLRNLIAAGHLPAGDVDERSIVDISPNDLAGYRQCHFFAGIGGWAYALRLAGWPDDREVWTGSCPCQPLSSAGQRKGHADERHLWPAFHRLIAERRPATVFGEQVASKDGREWLAGVRADLEALGYGVGAADLCAAGVGAPHIRQRVFWLANSGDIGHGRQFRNMEQAQRTCRGETWPPHGNAASNAGSVGGLGFADSTGSQPGFAPAEAARHGDTALATGDVRGLANASAPGRGALQRAGATDGRQEIEPDRHRDAWAAHEWLPCTDGKARRVEPGTFPLAHGVPARVGRLRGYGNAIVPQVAAEFVSAFMNATDHCVNPGSLPNTDTDFGGEGK